MNILKITKIALATAAIAFATTSSQALVLVVDINNSLALGIADPTKASPEDEAAEINKLITMTPPSGPITLDLQGGNDPKLTRSANVWANLPTADENDHSGNIDVSLPNNGGPNPNFTNSGSGWDYVLAKYGNAAMVWYLDGAAFTVPMNGSPQWTQGNGLSHWIGFNSSTTNVPDGGATVALLGLGALALAAARRKA